MKTVKTLVFALIITRLASCEDIVDVDVQEGAIRLVVEASLDWEKGTEGSQQTIRLSESTPFYETKANTKVQGAAVVVSNTSTGEEYFFEDQGNGEYLSTSFKPILGQSYTLRIESKGEIYTATETMTPVTDITHIYQEREDGFDEDELEIHIEFTDPEEEGNNYLFKFQREGDLLPALEVGEDRFLNGNEIDWWYEIESDENGNIEPFKPGDLLHIEMYGISRAYYDYINIVASQLGGTGLFESIPITVKGNCINETNPDNYAYGYFRLSQVVKASYTFIED